MLGNHLMNICVALLPLVGLAASQSTAGLTSSYPHAYPGMPTSDYSPTWQKYFQVTSPLPNVTFPLQRNWAGNINVNRAGHANDSLFFWGFEQSVGSLTNTDNSKPWGIFLNGGPGSSSMIGLLFENGPLRINPDYTVSANKYSWSNVVDYFWVDNPVGVGFSTADANGYALNEDQLAQDFLGFLTNLVKVFPGLAKRPLYLTGESYAGVYIPYILKAYLAMSNPTFTFGGIGIGDGSISGIGGDTAIDLPTLSVIETYPQLIGYSTSAYNFFKAQNNFCGFDINFTYPQTGGPFPNILVPLGGQAAAQNSAQRLSKQRQRMSQLIRRTTEAAGSRMSKRQEMSYLMKRKAETADAWLASQNPNALNSWYGCDLNTMLFDYATNYSTPFNVQGVVDYYDIPDATGSTPFIDASVFLTDSRTVSALHAPTSQAWVGSAENPFGTNGYIDPSVAPTAFMSQLASDASKKNVKIVLWSGNDDGLLAHRGTEAVIQNTTFGGVQGFWRVPSTPFNDLNGNFAGIVHQERGWTYALIMHASHLTAMKTPAAAFTFVRDFIIGTVKTGLVTSPTTPAIGGENSTLAQPIIRGQNNILYLDNSGATQTYTPPAATLSAWNKFMASASPFTPTTAADARATTTISSKSPSKSSSKSSATPTTTKKHQCA